MCVTELWIIGWVCMCAHLNACMSVSKAHGKTSQTSYFFKLIHYEVTLWQEKSLPETFINYVIQNIIEQFRFGGQIQKDRQKINLMNNKNFTFESENKENIFRQQRLPQE